jgi:hypothetical protein
MEGQRLPVAAFGRYGSMFETLDERIKHDEKEASSASQRLLYWVLVGVVTLAVCGGLYFGVHMLS